MTILIKKIYKNNNKRSKKIHRNKTLKINKAQKFLFKILKIISHLLNIIVNNNILS